jgi:hypothetical protein
LAARLLTQNPGLFFCVEEDHARVNPWPPQRECFWVINGRSETEGYRFFCRQSFWPYRCLLRGLVLACRASRNPALEAAFTPAASFFGALPLRQAMALYAAHETRTELIRALVEPELRAQLCHRAGAGSVCRLDLA